MIATIVIVGILKCWDDIRIIIISIDIVVRRVVSVRVDIVEVELFWIIESESIWK